MSASLVGSEMCIRDRRMPDGQQVGFGGAWKHVLHHVQQDAAEHILAVSYTHLTLPTICSV
eukprot:7705490-Alexandrium_andersonii.AAC.1